MAPITTLDAGALRAIVTVYRDVLLEHRAAINRLNVYPVPDGDTGTNMSLTLQSVAEAVDGAADTIPAIAGAIAKGSLMGARGNSGVILSQILRGFTEVVRDQAGIDGPTLASALDAAAIAAYGAVGRPVEGTILTVVRAAADGALAAGGDAALADVLELAHARAEEALARTPELLPVLAEAGVVDAGGSGLLLLLDAARSVVEGRPLPEPELVDADEPVAPAAGLDPGDLRYEVMYFLDADDAAVAGLRDAWAELGDSIVVVGGDGLWNCHVHTNDIGGAIEAGIAVGRPHQIRVTDLYEEVAERDWVAAALPAAPTDELPAVTTAVVAVAVGEGVTAIFRSMGVQQVVVGGQTMNPSTADLLSAVERVNADQVVVLPNNKNIVAVAGQLDAQTDRTVRVVATHSVAEGFAALVAYDPEASVDANLAAMAAAAEGVLAGEVTTAVRASVVGGVEVGEGDIIGLVAGRVRVARSELLEATTALLDELVTDEHELLTIIVGAGVDEATTSAVAAWVRHERPDVEVEVHHGGQPLYPYLFGVE